MRILFVNHTGASSGAELALMRLVEGIKADHSVAVACPGDGPLAKEVVAAGVEHFDVPAFEASLRLDPVQTPVGLARMAIASAGTARVVRRHRPHLIHANTPRAGLMVAAMSAAGGPPLVVRAHEQLPLTPVGRGVRFVLARSAAAVPTVSKNTAAHFNEGLRRPLATHVYNSFDRGRFDPERVQPAPIREELGIEGSGPLLGQIAQITPWKGQDTAIRAVAQVRDSGVDAHLLIVGEVAFAGKTVRYDNRGFERDLHALASHLGVERAVHFLGRRDDVPALMRALDLSLLPSWDEPFANVMLESMAMGTPLLVSEVGGGPELVEDQVSGRLLPPKRPELWAEAILSLVDDAPTLTAMGARAREATAGFDDDAHARDMLAVYRQVLNGGSAKRATDEPGRAAAWPG